MANNSVLPATGEVIRTDDRAGIKTQVVRIDRGTDATEAIIGVGANSMPVLLQNAAGTEVGTSGNRLFVQQAPLATGTDSVTAVGTLTNAGADPAATNLGVLPALANASAPTIAEGRQTLLSTDLGGALRVASHPVTNAGTFAVQASGTKSNAATPGATNLGVLPVIATASAPSVAEGVQTALSTDLSGGLRVASHPVTNAGTFAVQATLQAGSAGIGKLTANDAVDIGDVTVNNAAGSGVYVRPGTATTWATQAAQGALTDRSGTITTGGSSQTLAASNSARHYLVVQNVATEMLWMNFTSAAAADSTSLRLGPGDSFEMGGAFVSTEAVTILGATTGSRFIAKEG